MILSGQKISRIVNETKVQKQLDVFDSAVCRPSVDIEPFNPENINPHSCNLTIGNKLLIYEVARPLHDWYRETEKHGAAIFSGPNPPLPKALNPRKKNPTVEFIVDEEEGFTLYPGIIYLANTIEKVTAYGLAPQIDGRSSFGRLGLIIHLTAGYIDSGFSGNYTLELTVIQPFILFPFVPICQVTFEHIDGNVTDYTGKYNGQTDPTPSRSYQEVTHL